jgi:hypothetical protein
LNQGIEREKKLKQDRIKRAKEAFDRRALREKQSFDEAKRNYNNESERVRKGSGVVQPDDGQA